MELQYGIDEVLEFVKIMCNSIIKFQNKIEIINLFFLIVNTYGSNSLKSY